ncbi:MAG TPA: DUF2147 domain-containing protein [Desulfuromonadaceae bacterium]|jgi:uncharacterized protein (DUF2147 family)
MSRIILAVILLSAVSALGADQDILGVWKTEGGDSKIDLFRCGEKICGKIIWLRAPNYLSKKDGPVWEPKTDRKNPDPKLRSRPIIGLQVMSGLVPKGDKSWDQGACYDPESGKKYRCKMKLVSSTRLNLRGYIGISLIGRNFALTR